MNNIFEKDLYRYYGEKGESLKDRIFRKPEIRYIYLLRQCQNTSGVIKLFYRFLLNRLSKKTQIQIPYTTKIGEGFNICHLGTVIINPKSIIGKNVSVSTGVLIGQQNRGDRKGCPKIGNSCWIGSNAVIVGRITIGNDVLIAPNSYVNFDVPDHSVVVGNPGVIHFRENATKDYIENKVL